MENQSDRIRVDEIAEAIEQDLFGGRLPLHVDAPKMLAESAVRLYCDDAPVEIKRRLRDLLEMALLFRLTAQLAAESAEFKN